MKSCFNIYYSSNNTTVAKLVDVKTIGVIYSLILVTVDFKVEPYFQFDGYDYKYTHDIGESWKGISNIFNS